MARDTQGQLGLTFNAVPVDDAPQPAASPQVTPPAAATAEPAHDIAGPAPAVLKAREPGAAPPPTRKIWTVRELVSTIRGRLEREFSDVWFEGEISNYRPAGSGHLYFSIADGDAQLKIVMFRSSARLLRFKPENGMHIIGRGRVTIYDQRGELQINAEYLEPKGAGALQVAFEQLKAKLAAEGLFDPGRKRPIPKLPRTIGIVTSPRGAAIQDMLNVLRRRHEDVNILIYPAQVQGELAPLEVAAGVRYFNMNANVDVIVVARGGGSVEDLAAFNDEMLARTIADSKIPTISAIGHEIDFTITDFVADLRAPTPSAAAELVIEAKQQLDAGVNALANRLQAIARHRLLEAKHRLNFLSRSGAFERMRSLIHRRQQRVDELVFRLTNVERSRLQRLRQRLDVAETRVKHHDFRRALSTRRYLLQQREQRLATIAHRLLLHRRGELQRVQTKLQALSPLSVLDRGYALVFDTSGRVVRSVEQVQDGTEILTRLGDGELRSKVSERRPRVRE
jgi:exodeoxyribonuclease VII large subunit